jgi:hypothetical protein
MRTSEYLLSKFIQYNSNIIIIVVGQLTLSAQELIYNIKYEVKKGKVYDKILIIHNLQNLYKLEDIKNYIDNTLRKSVYNNLYKRKFINLDKDEKNDDVENPENYYFFENTDINNSENKQIIHLIMGNNSNNDNQKSECIKLNSRTLKFINDCITEVNVNNEKSKDMIENIKHYVKEYWITNKNIANEEYNKTGHIFCMDNVVQNNRNLENYFSINTLNYTYYIKNKKFFVIKIELTGANEKNTICDYKIKKERGNYTVKINIKTFNPLENKEKEFNIIFPFDESKINIEFSNKKNHFIKNGIITIIYHISFPESDNKK